jgi:hypothetical protein
MKMTYEIAHAAGWDVGNRNMRENGRTVWNQEDYDVCWAEFNRLMPLETTEPNLPTEVSCEMVAKFYDPYTNFSFCVYHLGPS